jgi:hypothetical protein
MWFWRRVEKISWAYRVGNVGGLQGVMEERTIVDTVNGRKANWIGYVLSRNCLLIHDTKGMRDGSIDVTGYLGRRRRQLLDVLKDVTGYWKLKEEAPDSAVQRTGCRRGSGPY